jgi:acetolactate synthase regulatory subunit
MEFAHDSIQFLRMQKLGKNYHIKNDPDIVEKSMRHNFREIYAERHSNSSHIDSNRSHLNYVLRGKETAEQVDNEMTRLLDAANIKITRVNTIRAFELVFSFPPDVEIDTRACFEDFVLWVETFFKDVPILSAVVHLDEAAPHVHVVLLPLLDGKLNGHKIMGNKTKIHQMRKSCNEKVGRKYGLQLSKSKKRNIQESIELVRSDLNQLLDSPQLLKDESTRDGLAKLLANQQAALSKLVNKSLTSKRRSKRAKTFTDIFIQKCKPDSKHPYKTL